MKTRLRTPKKCKSTGKTRFKVEKFAGRAMMRIWSHDTSANIYDLHTYKCEHCGDWHVGHKSYYEKKLAQQEKIHEPVRPQINQDS